jgi:hypothetical protein
VAARTIGEYRSGIIAYMATGISNGRTEGPNGKARTTTTRSHGVHGATSPIGTQFLCCSGLELKPLQAIPRFR